MGTEAFFPVPPVGADNGRNGIFIKKKLRSKNPPITGFAFIALYNGSLYRKWDLRIRDNGRKKERVCMPAGTAENPGNPKKNDLISHPDSA